MSKEQTRNHAASKTVLVVEDSPVQAFAMIQLLEQRGLNIFSDLVLLRTLEQLNIITDGDTEESE